MMGSSYRNVWEPPVITNVEQYWTAHTVNPEPFASAEASLAYLDWRAAEYPLSSELLGLWGDHRRDVVLDYGCGPGNDVVGFLLRGNAKRVIGMDVSPTALEFARSRLALHDLGHPRVTLVKMSDEFPEIPLRTASVDYINCAGVLHHTSHPEAILAEFRRVLRPGGSASIMVYNYDSIFLHLYVAHHRQLVQSIDGNLPVEEAFRRCTDGEGCPISVPYRPNVFAAMCKAAGFTVAFRGGHFSATELTLWRETAAVAMRDERLGGEHRAFLAKIRVKDGLPHYRALPAGSSGVYELRA